MTRLSLVVVVVILGYSPVAALDSVSAQRVGSFVRALQAAGVDAFAAADPGEEGRFVAALYVPGQLLVVSARHPSAIAVQQRIAAEMYRDVYLDLQGTPTREGKFFVQDVQADGLIAATPGNGGVDVVYIDGTKTLLFNGDNKAQHLTDAQYATAFAGADMRYARILETLATAFAQHD
jgi:hypothetical protein